MTVVTAYVKYFVCNQRCHIVDRDGIAKGRLCQGWDREIAAR